LMLCWFPENTVHAVPQQIRHIWGENTKGNKQIFEPIRRAELYSSEVRTFVSTFCHSYVGSFNCMWVV
jgi:hypothetical protein